MVRVMFHQYRSNLGDTHNRLVYEIILVISLFTFLLLYFLLGGPSNVSRPYSISLSNSVSLSEPDSPTTQNLTSIIRTTTLTPNKNEFPIFLPVEPTIQKCVTYLGHCNPSAVLCYNIYHDIDINEANRDVQNSIRIRTRVRNNDAAIEELHPCQLEILSQFSPDRIPRFLQLMRDEWEGFASVAVFLKEKRQLGNALKQLSQLADISWENSEKRTDEIEHKKHIDEASALNRTRIHIVVPSYMVKDGQLRDSRLKQKEEEEEKKGWEDKEDIEVDGLQKEKIPYPINILRNAAFDFGRPVHNEVEKKQGRSREGGGGGYTNPLHYAIVYDIDFVLSNHTCAKIQGLASNVDSSTSASPLLLGSHLHQRSSLNFSLSIEGESEQNRKQREKRTMLEGHPFVFCVPALEMLSPNHEKKQEHDKVGHVEGSDVSNMYMYLSSKDHIRRNIGVYIDEFHKAWRGQQIQQDRWLFGISEPYLLPYEDVMREELYGWFHKPTIAALLENYNLSLCHNSFMDRGYNKLSCWRTLNLLGVKPVITPESWIIHHTEHFKYRPHTEKRWVRDLFVKTFCDQVRKVYQLPWYYSLCSSAAETDAEDQWKWCTAREGVPVREDSGRDRAAVANVTKITNGELNMLLRSSTCELRNDNKRENEMTSSSMSNQIQESVPEEDIDHPQLGEMIEEVKGERAEKREGHVPPRIGFSVDGRRKWYEKDGEVQWIISVCCVNGFSVHTRRRGKRWREIARKSEAGALLTQQCRVELGLYAPHSLYFCNTTLHSQGASLSSSTAASLNVMTEVVFSTLVFLREELERTIPHITGYVSPDYTGNPSLSLHIVFLISNAETFTKCTRSSVVFYSSECHAIRDVLTRVEREIEDMRARGVRISFRDAVAPSCCSEGQGEISKQCAKR